MSVWQGTVTVISIQGCPHCRNAKTLLGELGVPYTDLDVSGNSAMRAWVLEKTGKRTVPQIFLNALHVGGNSELQELHKQGMLAAMLEEVKNTPTPPDAPQIMEAPIDEEGEAEELVCQMDTVGELVAEMRAKEGGLDIKDRRYHLIPYTQCFTGKGFVEWMLVHKRAADEAEAIKIGNELLKVHGVFDHVKGEHELKNEELFYRFTVDSPQGQEALNIPEDEKLCAPVPAGELAKQLRVLILQLYDQFLSSDGKAVDYDGIAASPLFQEYVSMAYLLQRTDVVTLNKEEKLAFWINVYNALVIHKTAVDGKPTSTWQRFRFFTKRGYIIQGHHYSLNDIENGILRSNRSPPMMRSRQWRSNDPRMRAACDTLDARIHFALVCGAVSCPPIKTYDASNVEEALTGAAMAFFDGDGIVLDEANGTISITRICKWYRGDFGPDDAGVVSWIVSFLEGDKRLQCLRMISTLEKSPSSIKISYQKYNWGSNSK
mmetsp:Transcript_5027/g.12695  ORF Transcript_5027/g.12695 Transcript_5027/m.12695 type:complete len:489 (-) Transcript_5027:53-1519(-)|eukprot:CAMPEP_0206235258 /NCGR_PEP_ID=MMETSP0047_2-20121206/13051_1 /ASSEMBLY_ACC=CAM_ASM_000192 /TAXON_ID=195065 /ORGANISM="Chroomonas mesostigmatica_cf, Strain CCMP1168" /LENGTH=488 /DNA_ID=CAMNT_0053659445 /DNA_START=86 /DNA_END=1552 /DNA_ORIENTATION=-